MFGRPTRLVEDPRGQQSGCQGVPGGVHDLDRPDFIEQFTGGRLVESTREREPEVVAAARAAAEEMAAAPFDVAIDRADCFGRRVGWLGCSRVPPVCCFRR